MRVLAVLGLLCCAFAFAHTGFNQLSWQEDIGAYRVSVLEDFHLTATGEGKAQLLVQLSNQEDQAVAATNIDATIRFEGEIFYEGSIPFLTNSSQDGRVFYAAYLKDFDLHAAGWYELELAIRGPLGEVRKNYLVQSQQENPVPLLEYLPSALILLLCLGGLGILFMPLPTRKEKHETLPTEPGVHKSVA